MIDTRDLLSKEKSIVIAPAGYGKTHLIVDCLKESEKKQLILTHTHAGVAAIKERIKKAKIESYKYHVETITSFSQKYVLAFYQGEDLPKQEDSKDYYPFVVVKCSELLKIDIISRVFKRTYSGLFVDEYQDCTINQHELIKTLSNHLPTRLFGDPLQGIFDFGGTQIVNLEDETEFGEFYKNKHVLTIPWRWKGTNEPLGCELDLIRKELVEGKNIDISQLSQIESREYNPSNLYDSTYNFSSLIYSLLSERSLLIIHPESSNIHARINFNKAFKNQFYLLESIDGRDFYKEASELDSLDINSFFPVLKSLSEKLFNKTVISNWFNETGAKNKRREEDKVHSEKLKAILDDLKTGISTPNSKHFLKLWQNYLVYQ